MASVLITGITSFLGRGIANEMLARGHRVYGLIRSDSKNNKDLDTRIIKIICNAANIEKLLMLKNFEVDVLIHLAWDGVGKEGRMDLEIQKSNIEYTLKTMEAVRKWGCKRVLFAGSQAEYGFILEEYREQLLQNRLREAFEDSYLRFLNLNADASILTNLPANIAKEEKNTHKNRKYATQLEQLIGRTMINETFPCYPKSPYGKAKLEVWEKASVLCKDLGMEYIHMRIFSIYGASDHETSLIKTIIRAKKNEEEVTLSACNQLWNYFYIDDCARAIADLTKCDLGDFEKELVVNVASKDTKIMRAFASAIDSGNGFVRFEKKEPDAEGTPFLSPCTKRLRALTKFEEKFTFEEGIREIERLYTL